MCHCRNYFIWAHVLTLQCTHLGGGGAKKKKKKHYCHLVLCEIGKQQEEEITDIRTNTFTCKTTVMQMTWLQVGVSHPLPVMNPQGANWNRYASQYSWVFLPVFKLLVQPTTIFLLLLLFFETQCVCCSISTSLLRWNSTEVRKVWPRAVLFHSSSRNMMFKTWDWI